MLIQTTNFGDGLVHKFGHVADVDTLTLPEDIWSPGGVYTWPSAAAATAIVSDSANDADEGTGAQTVAVYGLDSNWNEISENVTMNGVGSVALSNNYLRVYRAKVLTSGSSESNEGTLTITVDGGTVATIAPNMGQTLMALFTSADDQRWEIISLFCSLAGQVSGNAEIALQARVDGGAWQTKMLAQVSESQSLNYVFHSRPRLGAKTDVRVRVLDASANNMGFSSTFSLVRVR